ncbi:Platelet-activating factor acetylhydrolase [Tolypocladium paradoxum]|uniref:Putative phospholipase n=1 Tax=Tolypocladium paradoxum TaxID=94208 RepID=A0A2S4KZZ2_9HYPO|nr:Platelet-activating factor acetylhydrolase [Tolypocladium paradoxum]
MSDSDLELDSLDSPDAPLTTPTATQPKWQPPWLSPRASRLHALKAWLRRRRSWTYMLCVAACIYVLVCLLRRVPLLASPLPGYTGPHAVGSVDVEVPLAAPQRIADTLFRDTRAPAFELETVLFTLYYPVARGARSPPLPAHPWIDRPLSLAAEGYARFAHVNSFITRPVFTLALWLVAGGLTVPAEVDGPLLGSEGGHAGHLPVMVFSHGAAASRTDYTAYLGELASRGHVVAALEHRDGSCPGSLVRLPDKPARRVLPFSEGDLAGAVDAPRLKTEQLAFRDAEVAEAIRVLRDINDGRGDDVYAANTRGEGATFSGWTNRLDFSRLVLGGHSYGAALALQSLAHTPSAAGGIILDPGKSSGPLNASVATPLLVVHSDSWSRAHSLFHGRPHFDAVRDLVRGVLDRTGAAWFLTSIGTAHPSVSDAPLIEPLLLRWTTGAHMDVRGAMRQYVRVSVEFLDFLATDKAKGLLAEEVTHEKYGEWVSKAREQSFPKDLASLWEIHVSPASDKPGFISDSRRV